MMGFGSDISGAPVRSLVSFARLRFAGMDAAYGHCARKRWKDAARVNAHLA